MSMPLVLIGERVDVEREAHFLFLDKDEDDDVGVEKKIMRG